ncbi:hypothetical protein Bca101_074389 [Brassica carinata]
MLTLLFFSLGLLLLLGLLLKFAFADELICSLPPVGDFTLISKKEVKREAIEDKVVWITGANRGIGEALAKQFASLGAKLILSARNEAELFRIKSELKGKYAPEHVKCRFSLGGYGVDYLIHNAAYEGPKSNAVDASEENLEISSAAGKVPSPGQAIYAASKHALQGYFHSLRSEKGIKVTVVCPGPIETPNGTGTSTSEDKNSPEKRVSSERCAELTIIAASHNLKEAWISYQPVLLVMYLVQYMPSLGLWLMDKVGGGKRVEKTVCGQDKLLVNYKNGW